MKNIKIFLLALVAAWPAMSVAQSDFLRFADWMTLQGHNSTSMRQSYRAGRGLTTDIVFNLNDQETKFVQQQELRGQLAAAMESAEQSCSLQTTDSGCVHRSMLAVNGLNDRLVECTSAPAMLRSFDLSNHGPFFEYIQCVVREKEGVKMQSIQIYQQDARAAQDQVKEFNLAPACDLLQSSSCSEIVKKNYDNTHAKIYQYASEEDMPTAALEALFSSMLRQHQECEVVHEAGMVRISSSSECMIIHPASRRILHAHSTKSAELVIPHNWWE